MRVIDMHCDTIGVLHGKKLNGEAYSLRENLHHVDLQRMKEGKYMLQNFALFVYCGCGRDLWEEVCAMASLYQEEIAKNQDLILPVYKYADIAANAAQGKMSAMLTVEEGAVCKGEIEKLQKLYDMGVRMMTLTWNYPNEIGYPNLDSTREENEDFLFVPDTVRGLTEKGREMVAAMDEMGMIVDVSHLSDAGFYDVLDATKKPFVASHSNARSIAGCVRNLTDDMLKKLGERGGCTGLNYAPDFLTDVPLGCENPGTIAAIVEHSKHIVNVAGIETLALGSDYDGIGGHAELPGVQSLEHLWDGLHKAGFTQGDLDKIFCENVLRVYRDVLK